MRTKLLFPFLVVSSFIASPKEGTPGTFLYPNDKFSALRENYKNGTLKSKAAFQRLLREAKKALTAHIPSILDKKQVPPSGDKHDYISTGKYWWPDASKPDGLPYIKKDGIINPEINDYADKINLNKVISTVHTLAIAFYITENQEYAKHAVDILKEWFISPETKMNPHLEYSGCIPGKTGGSKSGIIDTHRIDLLVDAMVLLDNSEACTADVKMGLHEWSTSYLKWLANSKIGKAEGKSKNNHATWYDVQVISLALYIGQRDLAIKIAQDAMLQRITAQIEPDGTQPAELVRTNSWGYSNFNLLAMFHLGLLAESVGVDLWHYENNGRSIRKALDYLLPFAQDTSSWRTKQISEFKITDLYQMLLIAENKFHDAKYENLRRKFFGSENENDIINLFYY